MKKLQNKKINERKIFFLEKINNIDKILVKDCHRKKKMRSNYNK